MTRSTMRLIGALVVVLVIGATFGLTTYKQPKADEIVSRPCLNVGTVSVVADRREATVTPSQTGRFKFIINPSTTGTTQLKFDISGSASRSDYVVSAENAQDLNFDTNPGTITFKERSTTAYAVIAIANPAAYIDKTVTVTLREDASLYNVGSPKTATVRLFNPDPGKPAIVIDTPSNGAHYTSSSNLTVPLTAHINIPANATGTRSVVFYGDGTASTFNATISGQSATANWVNPPVGTHTLRAQLTVGQTVVNSDDKPYPDQQVSFIVDPVPPTPTPTATPTPGVKPTATPGVVRPAAFLPTDITNYLLPKAAAQDSNATRVICGTIVDADTQQPISGVSVMLLSEWKGRYIPGYNQPGSENPEGLISEATTDRKGEFLITLTSQPVEKYRIRTRETTLYPSKLYWYGQLPNDMRYDVNAAASPIGTRIEMKLRKGGFIHGRVTDHLGKPINNLDIGIGSIAPGNVGIYSSWTKTDAQGNYVSLPLPLTDDRVEGPLKYSVSTKKTEQYPSRRVEDITPLIPKPGAKVDIAFKQTGRIYGLLKQDNADQLFYRDRQYLSLFDEANPKTRIADTRQDTSEQKNGFYEFTGLTLSSTTRYRIEVRTKGGKLLVSKGDIQASLPPGTEVNLLGANLAKWAIETRLRYATEPLTVSPNPCRNQLVSHLNQCVSTSMRSILTKIGSNIVSLRRELGIPAGKALTTELRFYPPLTTGQTVEIVNLAGTVVATGVTTETQAIDDDPSGVGVGAYQADLATAGTYKVRTLINPINLCLKVAYAGGTKYVKISGPASAIVSPHVVIAANQSQDSPIVYGIDSLDPLKLDLSKLATTVVSQSCMSKF